MTIANILPWKGENTMTILELLAELSALSPEYASADVAKKDDEIRYSCSLKYDGHYIGAYMLKSPEEALECIKTKITEEADERTKEDIENLKRLKEKYGDV